MEWRDWKDWGMGRIAGVVGIGKIERMKLTEGAGAWNHPYIGKGTGDWKRWGLTYI